MATRHNNRIVVRSKSKTSVMSPTSSSISERSSSSESSTYTVPVLTSTPARQNNYTGLPHIGPPAEGGANSQANSRPHSRFKNNKVRPLMPENKQLRIKSVSNGVPMLSYISDGSSSSDDDSVFRQQHEGKQPTSTLSQTTPICFSKPNHSLRRPMYFSTSQLLPSLYVTPSNGNSRGLGSNQILPSSVVPISGGRLPNMIPASPSPSLNSTFSLVPSPLSPLLIQSMRKGGNKPSPSSNWKRDTVLESVLPGGILKVFIGTWNMNEIKVIPACIDDFLLPANHETAGDLIVIGTQESSPDRNEWEVLLQQTLGPTHVLIQSAVLGVLYLHVFLRRDLIWYCSEVQSSSFATRSINVIKTKGGVAVRLTLFGSSFLFISCHLSAGTSKCIARNADVHKIASGLQFVLNEAKAKTSVVDAHDFIFWCGDLNYRLELDKKKAEEYISKSDWTQLLLKDQLTREILAENVFSGFSEQPVAFPPSYKFDINSSQYDSSEKLRTPSWTDRVLFRSSSGGVIEGCGYGSDSTISSSDHRPVYGIFNVQLQPLEEFDGVPAEPAGYNRGLYAKAMKRRKQVASTSICLQEGGVSVSTSDPPQRNTPTTNSSSFCSIL